MITQITDKEIAHAATIEALRQEVTAWSVTAENLEAELETQRRTHCACVLDGDAYVEQCELHAAWKDALHEQADYRRERDALQEKLAESEKCLQDSIDCNLNRLLAMTDEQVTALTRLEGSNPEEVAALARKTMELAVANVKLAEAEAVITQRNAMIPRGIDDFVQTLTDPENQPSQWGTVTLSMYQAVEAERDALKALNLKLAIGVVALAYEADALFSVDEARELMSPFESQLNSIFAGEPSFEDQVCSVLKEANHD